MLIKNLSVLSLLAISTLSLANEPATPDEKDVNFGLHFGIGFGGDTLAEFTFDDGSTEEIKAGNGIILGASFQNRLNHTGENPLFAKVAFSYMFDSVDATNGDAKFSRYPLDLLLLSKANNISFGGGLTYHLNPTLSVNAPGFSGDADFDNALGFKVEANLHFNKQQFVNSSIGLEYTSIDYEIDGYSFDGSGINLTFKTVY
ncbi:MAG: hypothetical protein HWE18_16040 [Gammaproteobacteria bacterium]|nr:hypothetical protein [Gammaproteobacteria bacterium]